MGSRLAPAHERAVVEHAALRDKIAQHDRLITYAQPLALDGAELVRLVKRKHFLSRYSAVLDRRIAALAQEAADFPITLLQA